MKTGFNISGSVSVPGMYTSAQAGHSGDLLVPQHDTFDEPSVEALLEELDGHYQTLRIAIEASLLEQLAMDRRNKAKAAEEKAERERLAQF